MRKRVITVKEGGNLVYEGDDRRYYETSKEDKLFLGMFSTKEIIQAVIFISTVGAFLIQSNSRQMALEKAVFYLTEFSVNSDNWQSTVYGSQFKQGKPLNDAFVEDMIKRSFQKERRWR
jgi:hypothetical protein